MSVDWDDWYKHLDSKSCSRRVSLAPRMADMLLAFSEAGEQCRDLGCRCGFVELTLICDEIRAVLEGPENK